MPQTPEIHETPEIEASPSPDTLPVVIINGLGAPRVAAEAYGYAFRARGFDVYTAPQTLFGFGDMRVSVQLVADRIAGVLAATGKKKVRLVGMSLGGLIGLYYLKCAGGSSSVERFISVGGPLNGSALARLTNAVPSQVMHTVAHAVAQTVPDSPFMRELRAAPAPDGVRMISIGTRGDIITPRSSWDSDGLSPIATPYGIFPLGHWCLFFHPGNHRVVAEQLQAD